MNVTETNTEGLHRELKVVVGADELEQRLSSRLDELKGKAKIKGFRPGHVPKEHLRKVYGRSVMAEVVQQAVAETSREALTQREERPAFQPKVALPEDEGEINQIFEGTADLAYTLTFEVLPKVEVMDLSTLELERPTTAVTDNDIDEAIDRILATNQNYKPKDGAAEKADRVTIDFVGKLDGEAFEGGTAQDAPITLGAGGFIPGFEDGLMGVKPGDKKTIEATFPDEYPEAKLAGKAVQFEVTVKEVASPETPTLDDEFAKSLGVESVADIRETVKTRMEQDRAMASRLKVKRMLLDALNESHAFELPPTLVDNEFQAIWDQVTKDLEQSKKTFEDEGTTEDKAKEDYRDIATRRVRLGLLLSEIGSRNEITVTDEEVNKALIERIRQFPGQERQVYDFYRNTPEALAELRAPIYEDKVVDYVLELAKVTDKPVTVEDLYADPDGDHGHHHHDHDHDHDHDHGHKHD
ncbi:MAG TPA: trigger factor [Methyloceanibacter sp.]|nr:trigger factor [Methyloceanibacter sp.]